MSILFEILFVAILAILVARLTPQPWRGRLLNLFKGYVTIRAFWLLFTHQFPVDPQELQNLNLIGIVPSDATHVAGWTLIKAQLAVIEPARFWFFVGCATAIKFIGILASMYRWKILLRGQEIELPFRHIFGSFLIGRFIGTFLPSTAGLDGYKLYDAARFSGKSVEVTATTLLEKVLGVFGIFLTFLIALPFGIQIFGDNARLVASITVPIAFGLIGGLLLVLWFPGIVQWALEHFPIPAKERLHGVIMRISHAASAYRDKKGLSLQAIFLSFMVHFTTAAMYFFTALAISHAITTADFWPVVFGSAIQIFATVISPFTIAGEGIREIAQQWLLGERIGNAASIVSAALGFWAAEALTLLGGIFWWIRPKNYTPAFCRVNGIQVDYEESAKAAVALESEEERTQREQNQGSTDLPPVSRRLLTGLGYGFGAGIIAGILIGLAETFVISQAGFGADAQVLWYGPLAYALFLGLIGAFGGAALSVLPMQLNEIRNWVPTAVFTIPALFLALFVTLFRLYRDTYLEQMPPLPIMLAVLGAAALFALIIFLFKERIFGGVLGNLMRPLYAIVVLCLVLLGGVFAARSMVATDNSASSAKTIPSHLEEKPNIILVMVDTLRADYLSCYGAEIKTPALCSLVTDGGTRFQGYSHASWTKPATASLLTSLLPSTHGAMSKPSVLPNDAQLIAEVLQEHGYSTGGIVSNINLAESFGFNQGYDEYHYLGPDYLVGAEESSSKLILYQLFRQIWLGKVQRGLRFGDSYQDSEVVNQQAFEWLERNQDSRFFLFLHYMDPHDPYFEHPYNGEGIPRVGNQHPDPSQAAEMERLYRGEIEYLDGNFQKFLDHLRAAGVYDNTVIALVSDHGEEFYEHQGFWHGKTLYQEQIHVPFLLKWAKGNTPLSQDATQEPARLIDVAPTLIAQAGARIPSAMQGIDLANQFFERAEKDEIVFAEEDHESNILRAIIHKDWKLIEANEGNPRMLPTVELFHLKNDPKELWNKIEDEVNRLAASLREKADASETFARGAALSGGDEADLTDTQKEALRALGYME